MYPLLRSSSERWLIRNRPSPPSPSGGPDTPVGAGGAEDVDRRVDGKDVLHVAVPERLLALAHLHGDPAYLAAGPIVLPLLELVRNLQGVDLGPFAADADHPGGVLYEERRETLAL